VEVPLSLSSCCCGCGFTFAQNLWSSTVCVSRNTVVRRKEVLFCFSGIKIVLVKSKEDDNFYVWLVFMTFA